MSEEGEFKKRLSPYFEKLAGEFGDDPEELLELLDEARKEFPDAEKYYGINNKFDDATYFGDLDKWFLKWFGSGEKK